MRLHLNGGAALAAIVEEEPTTWAGLVLGFFSRHILEEAAQPLGRCHLRHEPTVARLAEPSREGCRFPSGLR